MKAEEYILIKKLLKSLENYWNDQRKLNLEATNHYIQTIMHGLYDFVTVGCIETFYAEALEALINILKESEAKDCDFFASIIDLEMEFDETIDWTNFDDVSWRIKAYANI